MVTLINVIGSVCPGQQEWNEWPFEIGGFVGGPPFHTHTHTPTGCVTSEWSLGIGIGIAKQLGGPI